jgi:HEAT repeat protein
MLRRHGSPLTSYLVTSFVSLLFAGSDSPAIAALSVRMAATQQGTIEKAPATQRQAIAAFNSAEYERMIGLLDRLPVEQQSAALLRMGVLSHIRLGRPDTALVLYLRLIPEGRPDDRSLLRELARAFIRAHVRHSQEYLRAAAYTALTESATVESIPLLEDGLLDASVLVRAQAVMGLGRIIKVGRLTAGVRERVGSVLRRGLRDSAASVQIATLTALGEFGDATIQPLLKQIVRTQEGPIVIFASAALVKLGDTEALGEITSAATLPDPESRMAALAVLGSLRRPDTLSLLTQSVYDPDPSVRAFGAGALGEFGRPEVAPSLTHALTDESPRVRSIAAASLGKLRLPYTRTLLWQAARDAVELVRVGAVEGLLRLGENEAILVAADLAKHADPGVRSATAETLGRVGNRKALRVLESLSHDQQPQPRLMAARAYGKIGGVQVLPPLKKALQDSEPAVQIAAAGSLVQVLSSKR